MNKLFWSYLSFVLAGLLWSLLIIWTNLWYLLILFNLVLFDIFVTRKIDWTLRRYGFPRLLQSTIEWMAILILAIVCSFSIKVLFVEAYKIPTPSMEETLLAGDFIFVSKLAYGPRLPETPLAIPFYHNKLPSGKKSYSERIKMPHKRLSGFFRCKTRMILLFSTFLKVTPWWYSTRDKTTIRWCGNTAGTISFRNLTSSHTRLTNVKIM